MNTGTHLVYLVAYISTRITRKVSIAVRQPRRPGYLNGIWRPTGYCPGLSLTLHHNQGKLRSC